jgi:hypothetical protein
MTTQMANELVESNGTPCGNSASPGGLAVTLHEDVRFSLPVVKAIKKLHSLLKGSSAKRRTPSPEDRIIASLAEKHATIFMT